ncbi:MAG: SH3 domain-containing protein [Proteobacteria bacterium]|nr:SH3 domain-containing protein [Pseudomonadota bacterium]MBU1739414.1 SH3 domain-containing protein [Pseudomonadota bacterium]
MKKVILTVFLVLALTVSAKAETMVSINGPKVNMRSGPGTSFSVLWELGDGFPLKIVGSKGDWYKVEDFEGDGGWIEKSLVHRDPHMIVKKQRINVRSGPGEGYRIVGKANYGVVFKTLKQKNGWVKVKHENGLAGWVTRSLLWGW